MNRKEQQRVVPVAEARYLIVELRYLRGAHDLVHRRAVCAVVDVLLDGGSEGKRVLQDDADVSLQRVESHVLDVVSVDGDAALDGIVETGN